MTAPLHGVLPILHTPFDDHDSIDRSALREEIDWVYYVGAQGVCSAMVSEILRLTEDERVLLTELMVQFSDGRGAVVASVGSESTKQAVEYARVAQSAGCTAIMAIPPISAALPEASLRSYFSTIADAVELPLIVQDASSYVGKAMSPAFLASLLDAYGPEKIQFKPEASPLGPNLSALRDATQGRAKIFDGSGGLLLVDAYRRGLTGTMPGCDVLDAVVVLWKALETNNESVIRQIAPLIGSVIALQLQAGLDGFLAIEKYLMVKRNLFATARRRAPTAWDLDRETAQEVDRLFADLNNALATLEPELASK
ncbi:dihydrodipicolinate synthase family protein [Planctomicrobium piriforme]|uniref:4-hydroxy-tetrahydrodipicolinate synthase n=1 Tax=Planctomicrobium piriforme TaxID=1576369 RepID=A0A1I3MIE4_9PLAN|nr:dihydrodipicolinate synthase family protein [Planctomicrobium piriforme]SFI96681.1 4-hydroxy-tetrahydrodipicolinate synthase [Planctomicrobium piriforme]